jgi:hypothetical protein
MLVIMERPAPDLQTVGYAASRERPWRRATYKWEPAVKNVRFIGLDVHAETIAVAVAEVGGEVSSLGVIPNRAESVRRLVGKLGKPEQLRVCYEAGPTGYVRRELLGFIWAIGCELERTHTQEVRRAA